MSCGLIWVVAVRTRSTFWILTIAFYTYKKQWLKFKTYFGSTVFLYSNQENQNSSCRRSFSSLKTWSYKSWIRTTRDVGLLLGTVMRLYQKAERLKNERKLKSRGERRISSSAFLSQRPFEYYLPIPSFGIISAHKWSSNSALEAVVSNDLFKVTKVWPFTEAKFFGCYRWSFCLLYKLT